MNPPKALKADDLIALREVLYRAYQESGPARWTYHPDVIAWAKRNASKVQRKRVGL